MRSEWHSRLRAAADPWLLALGAVLLACAPVLPGISRLLVLPALLLAPGYAFMRLLGRDVEWESIGIAVPVSIMVVIFSSLALYVSGVRLEALSLGPVLGAATALCLAGSYGRQSLVGRRADSRGGSAGSEFAHADDDFDVRERAPSR